MILSPSAGVSVRSPFDALARIGCWEFASAQPTGSVTGQESPVVVCKNQNDLEFPPARKPLGRRNDAIAATAVWRKVRRLGWTDMRFSLRFGASRSKAASNRLHRRSLMAAASSTTVLLGSRLVGLVGEAPSARLDEARIHLNYCSRHAG